MPVHYTGVNAALKSLWLLTLVSFTEKSRAVNEGLLSCSSQLYNCTTYIPVSERGLIRSGDLHTNTFFHGSDLAKGNGDPSEIEKRHGKQSSKKGNTSHFLLSI